MTTVLCVPQWQGSASRNAARLAVGARRTAELVEAEALESALEGLTGPVYVHIDLDVLDPGEFGSVCYPEPDGVPLQRLVDLISRLDNVVGAGVTEHAPADGAGSARRKRGDPPAGRRDPPLTLVRHVT